MAGSTLAARTADRPAILLVPPIRNGYLHNEFSFISSNLDNSLLPRPPPLQGQSTEEYSPVKVAQPDTDALLASVAAGDSSAREQLLRRHRDRLHRMVSCRLDPRLAPRIDPSDVVQDVLLEANRRLEAYLRKRLLPFYPWLRQLAVDQIGMTHRRHIGAARRSVRREEPAGLPDASAHELAGRLLNTSAGPSARLRREEKRLHIRAALDRLSERDREILALRYLEQLNTAEVAAVLSLTEAAVKMRLLRAIQRLHALVTREQSP